MPTSRNAVLQMKVWPGIRMRIGRRLDMCPAQRIAFRTMGHFRCYGQIPVGRVAYRWALLGV